MSPPIFLLLLGLIFLAPSFSFAVPEVIAISSSGGKIAPPQLLEHNFPIVRR